MVSEANVKKMVKTFKKLPGWPHEMVVPDGYPNSLALCIIDSIWSLGVRYRGVENVLDRYRTWLADTGRGTAAGRTAGELADDVAAAGGGKGFAEVVDNRQRTSSRNGILKAQAVADAATVLSDLGVQSIANLHDEYRDPRVKAAWTSVTGQRSGISWHYLLILAGIGDVKADRMVTRFARTAVDPKVTSEQAFNLVMAAYDSLEPAARPDLRTLDHAIWREASGRSGSSAD